MYLILFTILTISSAIYSYLFHRSLASHLHPISKTGTLPISISNTITSIPPQIYTSKYHALYDHVSRPVSRHLLPASPTPDLLTLLLRRNMRTFARFPQALMIRYITGNGPTFQSAHIDSLDFGIGDVVCGMYRVVERTGTKVEFEMVGMPVGGGRLVVRVEEVNGEVVFSSETVMWRAKGEKGLPLERGVVRFVHEITAWWLVDSGVRYLMDL